MTLDGVNHLQTIFGINDIICLNKVTGDTM